MNLKYPELIASLLSCKYKWKNKVEFAQIFNSKWIYVLKCLLLDIFICAKTSWLKISFKLSCSRDVSVCLTVVRRRWDREVVRTRTWIPWISWSHLLLLLSCSAPARQNKNVQLSRNTFINSQQPGNQFLWKPIIDLSN